MNQDMGNRLFTALSSELEALRDFVSLLEKEKNALIENASDELLELSEQKSARAFALNQLVEARHLLLQASIPELDAAAIQTWLQKNHKSAAPVWQEIRVLAERARQLNSSSGELIQMKLRHNQQALAVLGNVNSTANLYGPDGQRNFPPSSKPIASA